MAQQKGRKKRKVKLREKYVLVGEGATEKYYARHLKTKWGLEFRIRPRLFGNNMYKAEQYIDDYLNAGADLIVYFMDYDTIVGQQDYSKFRRLKKKYNAHKEVMICPSMPSIEYWFLLHFEYSTKRFDTTKELKKYLQNHISGYTTDQDFLAKTGWVEKLHENGGLQQAIERANEVLKKKKSVIKDEHHPFTYVHEGILSLLWGSPIRYKKYKTLQEKHQWKYW